MIRADHEAQGIGITLATFSIFSPVTTTHEVDLRSREGHVVLNLNELKDNVRCGDLGPVNTEP